MTQMIEGHGGDLALAALRTFGVTEMFTLSGGHVFPLYDAAHRTGFPIYDVRHEQSAVFAAEAVAKLQRRPGLAVLTAGPGVTNGISAVTSAYFNASPVLVLGGRAPAFRWGAGSLQEIDHVPLVAPVTRHAATVTDTGDIPAAVASALTTAAAGVAQAQANRLYSESKDKLSHSKIGEKLQTSSTGTTGTTSTTTTEGALAGSGSSTISTSTPNSTGTTY
jgi:thiamine pyrophosphate-dependent acetolactate synthase large subunit-like protein